MRNAYEIRITENDTSTGATQTKPHFSQLPSFRARKRLPLFDQRVKRCFAPVEVHSTKRDDELRHKQGPRGCRGPHLLSVTSQFLLFFKFPGSSVRRHCSFFTIFFFGVQCLCYAFLSHHFHTDRSQKSDHSLFSQCIVFFIFQDFTSIAKAKSDHDGLALHLPVVRHHRSDTC